MRKYRIEEDKILLLEEEKVLAEMDFPKAIPGVHVITRTFVDESLRGQGVANAMMALLLQKARKEGFLLDPICSYSVSYFEKHPETNFLRFEGKKQSDPS